MKLYIDGNEMIGNEQQNKMLTSTIVTDSAENKGYDLVDALLILQNAWDGCEESQETMAADFGIEVVA